MGILPGLFWISLVDSAGIGFGVGGWRIPGSSEKPPLPKKINIFFSILS